MAKNEFLQYVSPLARRNASEAMLAIFSEQRKFSTWRRLWLALAEAQKELGLDIPDEALQQMREHLDDVDFKTIEQYEEKLRHDVVANIHAFADKAPAARKIIHLGATSCFVTDNTDLILMREAGTLVLRYLANIIDRLGEFALKYRSRPTLGFTHFQPAQPTTVGKRACLWCYDFCLDIEHLESIIAKLPFRGVKGTTGTQASFLTLFDGDKARVQRLDRRVTEKMGFDDMLPLCGQTYSRKIDAFVVSALAGIAGSVHKFANDLRLLANLKEIEEPFEAHQVGSSAMAYKRNPMRAERATGLARFVMSLASSPLQTHAEQWLERTLDDSSNRRLVLPESFLATDGMLNLVLNITDGLVVNDNVIDQHLRAELPFMATEEILMAAVKAGGDRQIVHERIREHSLAASRQVKQFGKENDLIDRLAADPLFKNVDLKGVLDPHKYIGLAAEQVDEFTRTLVEPVRKRYADYLGMKAEVRV
jgi:adenylosuccinate lyase